MEMLTYTERYILYQAGGVEYFSAHKDDKGGFSDIGSFIEYRAGQLGDLRKNLVYLSILEKDARNHAEKLYRELQARRFSHPNNLQKRLYLRYLWFDNFYTTVKEIRERWEKRLEKLPKK